MIRLLKAEFTRLRSRKIAWLTPLFALLALGLITVGAGFLATPPSEAEVEQGKRMYEQMHADWEKNHEAQEKQCLEQTKNQADFDPKECEIEEPKPQDFYRQPLNYDTILQMVLGDQSGSFGAIGLALGVIIIVGASLVGAEFSTGNMDAWVTFVPKRTNVYLAKHIVTLAYSLIVAVVSVLLGWSISMGIIAIIQSPEAVTGSNGVWRIACRFLIITVVFSLIITSLAFLTRHSAATIGITFGTYLACSVVGSIVTIWHQLAWVVRLLPTANVSAVLGGKYEYSTQIQKSTPQGVTFEEVNHVITNTQAAIYLGVITLVLVVGAWLVFRRRDLR